MTPKERKNPKLIDSSRRQRIAAGSGVQAKQVTELVKQYDQMKPMLTGMAGAGVGDRAQQLKDLQAQMMDPSQMGRKPPKKGTGARLSPAKKKQMKKEREKRLRQMKREKRKGKKPDGDAS